MKTTYSILLPAAGMPQVIEFTADNEGLDYYYKHVDCDTIDIVRTTIEGTCLVVDDEGLFKEEPIVNPIASALYGYRQHGQPIVGNALLCKEEYTENGIETKGFDNITAQKILEVLIRPFSNYYKG